MVTPDYSVLLDTNILMSKTLRDWILILAQESNFKFFQPYVSSGILDEFGYKMRRRKPELDDGALEMCKKQIRDSTWDIISGFQVSHIPGYPDKNDLHVHAAADHGGMHALITHDTKLLNFATTPEGQDIQKYETMSADDFLTKQLTKRVPLSLFAQVYIGHIKHALRLGYKDFDVCKALDRTKDRQGNKQEPLAPQFARFLRTHIINRPDVTTVVDRMLEESRTPSSLSSL